MAENVDLPGVGKVKSVYVWVALAAVGGMVAFAWYQRGQAPAEDVTIPDELIPDTERVPPSGGGSAPVEVDGRDPDVISTNAQWTQRATEYLVTLNYDAALVSQALGKFLARQPLSAAEVSVVLAAKAAMGEPPVGGPYPLNSAPPPVTRPPVTPAPKPVTPPAKPAPKPPAPKPKPRVYTVRKGDTLSEIAASQLKRASRWPEIYRLNTSTIEAAARRNGRANSQGGKWIYPGTVLNLPA